MKQLVKHLLPALGFLVLAQAALAGNPDAGAEKVAICAACHGPDGNSPSSAFPHIAGLGERYLLAQLRDIRAWDRETDPELKATTGRAVPEMTGMMRNLSDQDLADIAAFYDQQVMQLAGSQEKEVRIYTGELVDSLELGERVYRAGNLESGVPSCMGCHAPDGSGNPPAGFPRLGGQHPEYIADQLRAFRSGERTNDGDTMMMRLTARNMTDAEIDAVANYIGGLH
ncbi:cytochrome c [Marinimicrobium sp. ABcell2]|uniref:c-type cytochrome n=1 Tax=Marinimicrobium sp. ABcell2 TaxID=3069751 RepID=UPI0027B4B2FA|nr:c-type cytochrome [Marinimicrobium sp. ABcell2]MDQ2076224.1 c-type cytochrome [Marinimicrobium sp. ABcell2]